MNVILPIILLLNMLLSASLWAEESNDFAFERFNLYFENDIFDKTDKGYTNGVKFSAIYNVNTDVYPFFKAPFFYDPSKNHFTTFSFGQDIFTPADTQAVPPNPEDSPYAGWLYVGMNWQQGDADNLDSLEIQVGVVGPAALGEEIQNGIHAMTGSQKALGWDYQLENEPGLIVSYEHRWRHVTDELFWGINADAIPYTGFALGNVLTYANAGASLRVGWNIPNDFGKSVTHPAQEAGIPAYNRGEQRYRNDFSFYFLAVVDTGFVVRNIFLDGNTFKDSASVPERDYLIGEFTAGFGIDIYDFHMAFMNSHKTQDFPLDANGFSFGTITVSYVY